MQQAAAIDLWLQTAADEFGTPCYVYDLAAIKRRSLRLRQAFGGRFLLSFAVKSNPNPALLKWLRTQADGLDVSSVGEFRLALAEGWPASRLSFTGPGKREAELREAIEGGVGELVVESVREAVSASTIAVELGRQQPILVRLAPATVPRGFGDQMAGRPSPFGIDVEDSPEAVEAILALPGVCLQGLHIYAGTQCLRAEAICENYRNFIEIFTDVTDRHRLLPKTLVFGSGLGIPYHGGDEPLDLEAVGRDICPDLDALATRSRFRGTRFVLEIGRYLTGEAGYFVTRVVSTKLSRGTKIAICDGGMNAHLPASGHFGMVMHRNYPMHKVNGQGPLEPVTLVGPLCTSIDRLANGVHLPPVEAGDLIAVHSSGAYGPSASPIGFIAHPVPREILIDETGLRDVTPSGRRL